MEGMFEKLNINWRQDVRDREEEEEEKEAARAEKARVKQILDRLARQQENAEREEEEEAKRAAEKKAKRAKQKAEEAQREAHRAREQARIDAILERLARQQEEQRRQRVKEKNSKSQAERAKPQAPRPEQTIQQWRAMTETLFADYSTMKVFPQPPVRQCANVSCKNVARNLRACSHSIEYAFRKIPNLDVKKERLRWHPDRFSSCPEQYRKSFQKMAQEVFVVLDGVYQRR